MERTDFDCAQRRGGAGTWRRGALWAALAVACALRAAASPDADGFDPTRASEILAERLKAQVASSPSLALKALVVGAANDGVALVGADGALRTLRRGGKIAETVDGVAVELRVRAVGAAGVELGAASGGDSVVLPGSFAPLPPPAEPPAEFLGYLESEAVPLGTLMRLIADQTGVNISVSDATRAKPVSIFLRNVTADTAVEEICRATDLLARREKGSSIIRILTKGEYAENLNSFREEVTELFTLLYPNVVEVASVIYGLYPDRTFLSLGEEEFEEDGEYDLSRRFRRFRLLEDNGGSPFMQMEAPQTSASGARSGGGNFSFSRGSALSRITQWDQLRRRQRGFDGFGAAATIGSDDARVIERAAAAGDTNLVDRVRAQATAAVANIFVSLSRKNNILIVRTSDRRVMEEIRALVQRLDVPTPMVLLELKVMELSIDDDYEASFRYAFNRATHTAGNSGQVAASALQAGMDTFNPTFAFAVVNDTLSAQIQLMQTDGRIKTLATPSLLVANNEVSRIFSGKQYPLVTGWRPGETTATTLGPSIVSTPTVEITKEDVGTMLLITPNINADKTVTLHLVQEESEVSPDKVDIPVDGGSGATKAIEFVESRSLAGTFVANDGMTIMAGGLVKEKEGETYWRTPVLGSIPLLGWLFRGTEKVKERTELIVLIKPHVILTPMEGGRLSEEVLKAVSAHPAADGRDALGVHKPDRPHTPADDVRNAVQ